MGLWNAEPPQGETLEQGLVIISRSPIPRFEAPQGISQEAVIEANLLQGLFPTIADETFNHYKFYQVNKGMVPSTQTNMPLVITDTLPPDPITGDPIMEPTGFDIRAADSLGVPIKIDTQAFTINPDNSIDFILWQKMPIVRDSEFIQLVFGKPSAVDGTTSGVWTDYERVWYMNSLPVKDSTENSIDGVETGGVTVSPGQIGNALDFTGGDKFVTFPTLSIVNNISVTIWVKYISMSQDAVIIAKNPINTQWQLFFTIDSKLKWRAGPPASGTTEIPIPLQDEWHQIVATQEGTVTKIYVDKELQVEGTDETIPNGTGSLTAGVFDTLVFFLDGLIDHTRIKNSILTADQITVQYNNQVNPNAFWHKTTLLKNGIPNIIVDDMGNPIEVLS